MSGESIPVSSRACPCLQLAKCPSFEHMPMHLHAGSCPNSKILPVSHDSLGKKQIPSFTRRGPAHSHLPHLSQRSGDIASQMKSAQVSTSFSSKGWTLSLQTKQKEWAHGDHSILCRSRLAQAKEEGLCVTANGISLLPAAHCSWPLQPAIHQCVCSAGEKKRCWLRWWLWDEKGWPTQWFLLFPLNAFTWGAPFSLQLGKMSTAASPSWK